jgi:hypothetical protein
MHLVLTVMITNDLQLISSSASNQYAPAVKSY